MITPVPSSRTLPLRGRVFRAVALAPEAPIETWLGLLDAALERSPTLLRDKAVILDLAALAPETPALDALVAELAGRGVRVLGLENAGPAAGCAALPVLAGGRSAGATLDVPADAVPALSSLTVEGTVRSGQTIVNREGDVTVMGSVSSGAEILAGGSIHVYGALRGRAIAGAAKNPRARIYCRKFEPELLGIDRLVRTAEDMGNQLRGQAVQIWSDGGAIKIAALG